MENKLEIRKYQPSDQHEVHRILLGAAQEARQYCRNYLSENHPSTEIEFLTTYPLSAPGGFWVGLSDNRVVGTVGLKKSGDHIFELCRLYVDPNLHGKRFGLSLLKFAEDFCQTAGGIELELYTSFFRERAIKFYRQNGFTLKPMVDEPYSATARTSNIVRCRGSKFYTSTKSHADICNTAIDAGNPPTAPPFCSLPTNSALTPLSLPARKTSPKLNR